MAWGSALHLENYSGKLSNFGRDYINPERNRVVISAEQLAGKRFPMSREYEINRPLRGNFLIDEDCLRNVIKHIREAHGEDPRISITFENDRTVRDDSWDKLISDSLIRSTKIKSIIIRCDESRRSTRLAFQNESSRTVDIDILGNREWALALEDHLLREVTPKKTWLSLFLSKNNHMTDVYMSFLWFGSIILCTIFLYSEFDNAAYIALVLFTILSLYGVCSSFTKLYVPGIQFDFGAGQRSYRTRAIAMKFVGGSVLLALVIGVAGNYLSKLAGI